MKRKSPQHYVSGKELIDEIWKSKLSYCEIFDAAFTEFDCAVDDLAEVQEPDRTILLRRADAHVPRREEVGMKGRAGKRGHLAPVPFVPFSLFRSSLDQQTGKIVYRETVRAFSHKGAYRLRGAMTPALVLMLQKIVNGRGRSFNWSGYSYLDEMKSEALAHLALNALMFDAADASLCGAQGFTGKQLNPLAYLTSTIDRSFLKILKQEAKQQRIRDDYRQAFGLMPSNRRQMEAQARV